MPENRTQVNVLWPLQSNGILRVTGQFGGFYGPPYDALGEFDYFNQVYGRRDLNENKSEEAINHLREAVKNMPENASFHNNLGTAFGRSGKVTEAMGEFEEAVKLAPTYVEARVNLANAFLSSGRVEDAMTQLNEALRLKPDFKPALQGMQRAHQLQDSSNAPK